MAARLCGVAGISANSFPLNQISVSKIYIVKQNSRLPTIGSLFLCFNITIMKLTPNVAEKIVTAVETSYLPLKRIAEYCGITYQTLHNWLKAGEDYQTQIEEGKIKKGDLTTKQKREVDLFLRVGVARTNKEVRNLTKIQALAEKKEDIKAFQWLLRLQDPVYRDGNIEEDVAASKSPQVVVVVSLSEKGGEKLLSDFMNGSDGEEKEGDTEETGDSDKS